MTNDAKDLVRGYIREILALESIQGSVAPAIPDVTVGTLPTPDEIFGPGGLRDIENFFRSSFGIFGSLAGVILSKAPELGTIVGGVGSFFRKLGVAPKAIEGRVARSILDFRGAGAPISETKILISENQSAESVKRELEALLRSARDIKYSQNDYDLMKAISSAHMTQVDVNDATLRDFLSRSEVSDVLSNFLKEVGDQTVSAIRSAVSRVPEIAQEAGLEDSEIEKIRLISMNALNSEYLTL